MNVLREHHSKPCYHYVGNESDHLVSVESAIPVDCDRVLKLSDRLGHASLSSTVLADKIVEWLA